MSDLTCPYCESARDVPDECHSEEHLYEADCNNCGKKFGFTISYWPSYTERELPCKNGEGCKWKEVINYSYIKHIVYECEYCGERESRTKDNLLEAQG